MSTSGKRLFINSLKFGLVATVIFAISIYGCNTNRKRQSVNEEFSPRREMNRAVPLSEIHSFSTPSREELANVYFKIGLPPPTATQLPPLTTCEVYQIGPNAPSYLGRVSEGNIAPYGIVLMARNDSYIVNQLLNSQINGLWEYSEGYGPTSADSALVIEGLLAAGVDKSILINSLEKIRDRYYDPESGGFRTVETGRARYWNGPCNEVTAHIAFLMQRVDPNRFQTEIESSAHYLDKSQAHGGNWEGKWFPSSVIVTFYAIRFLVTFSETYRSSIARATAFLSRLQRQDGSFSGSLMETSLAILALKAVKTEPEAVTNAIRWLKKEVKRGSFAGEPFLYYWFDDSRFGRSFFSCRDRGELTAAWTKIALNEL